MPCVGIYLGLIKIPGTEAVTMKTQISKLKNAKNRIIGYLASNEFMDSEGKSAQEANTNLESLVIKAMKNLEQETGIIIWEGHTIVVFPTLHGWKYWMDEFSRSDYSIGYYDTKKDAADHAYLSLAQQVWNHDSDDDDLLSKLPMWSHHEMKSWIKFQRSYREFQLQGLSPDMCHQKACGY
jgi:hypothetical protein